MSNHKMIVLGSQYPKFSKSPAFTDARADRIAGYVHDSEADILATTETGRAERARLASHLGEHWHYQGAQGTAAREGLNGLFWDDRAWNFTDGDIHDWTLRSHGQWTRSLLLVRLTEAADPTAFVRAGASHLAATGAPLNRAGANAAKWDQVHQIRELIGNKRVLIGMDFPRTDDDDDVAWLKKQGVAFHGRTDKTPMVAISKGAVGVTSTRLLPAGILDHQPNLISFTIPNAAPTPSPV